jgi:thermitase
MRDVRALLRGVPRRGARWLMLAVVVLSAFAGNLSVAGAEDAPAPLPVARAADGREVAPNRIIIGFQPGIGDAEKQAVRAAPAGRSAIAATAAETLADEADVVTVADGVSVEDAIASYAADPRVRYAEPDYVMRAFETPNDANFAQQYGMARIQAPAAWSATHGSASVKIAVLDCGIYEAHPDLAGKVVARRDFSGSAAGTDDRCNHGTHVAGIAGADTNNGIGVAGVGYDTALMNVKVLGDGGSGYESQITAGIRWATDNGANVINMSLGGPGACSQAYQDAIDYAWSRNVVIVVAAGNNGGTAPMQPADCNHVVSVASTDAGDARSGFSNYGAWVAVAAPGAAILSSVNPALNGGALYGVKSGTSMATPHVAGLAGLLWATQYGTSAPAVVSRLESTADPIAGTGTAWQFGRINAAAAIGGPAPVAQSLSVTSVVAGSGVLDLTVSGAHIQPGAVLLWNGAPRQATVIDSTQIAATLAAADLAQPGAVSIAVQNPDGGVSSPPLPFTIIAPAPKVSGVAPATGSAAGGDTVTINGAHFQAGLTVTFGGSPASVASQTETTVTVTTPPHAAGKVDVSVVNPDGQQHTLADGYTYTAASLPRASSPAPSNPAGPPAPKPASRSAPQPAPGSAGISSTPAPAPVHR